MLAVRRGAGAAGPPPPAGVPRQRVPAGSRWSGLASGPAQERPVPGSPDRDGGAAVVVRAPGTGARTSGAGH